MTTATPYIARDPSLKIGTDELMAHARRLALIPEDNFADVETFHNPGGEAPGSTTWTCEIEAVQSFGDGTTSDGLWDLLSPLAKTKVTFVCLPTDGVAVSQTNPQATFEAWVPTIPFVDSEVGQSTVMTLTFKVVGEPTFATA